MSDSMGSDFIMRYADYQKDSYGVPPYWALKSSMTAYASFLDKHVWTKNDKGRNTLNLWNVIFAPSGAGKSVGWDNATIPIMVYVSHKTDHRFVLPSIASSFEGITDRTIKDELRGSIFRDEITTLFKESKGGYTSTVLEKYSKLYDGWIYPRATRQVQVEHPMPVYVNLIGGSTPKYTFENFDIDIFYQGVGNRIDYELWKPSNSPATKDELFSEVVSYEDLQHSSKGGLDPHLQPFADQLVEVVKYVDDKDAIAIQFSAEAEEISVEYFNKQKALANAIPDDSRFSIKKEYLVRQWQKSMKYAGLILLSEPHMTSDLNVEVLFLKPEHIEKGQQITDHNYAQFELIVTEWMGHKGKKKETMYDDLGTTLKYLSIVKNYGELSQKLLAVEVGNTSRNKQFYAIVNFLMEAGCIQRKAMDAGIRPYILGKGEEWLARNMIKPNFSRAPTLYKFKKDLPLAEKETLIERGLVKR